MVHERVRHLLLGKWAQFTCDHAGWVLGICLAVAGFAMWITAKDLRFQADRNDLISRELEWNQRYIEFRKNFHGQQAVIVVVKVPEAEDGRRRAEQFVQTAARRLQERGDAISRVAYGFDSSQLSGSLLRLEELGEFKKYIQQISLAGPLLQAGGMGELMGTVTRELASPQAAGQIDATSGEAMIRTLGQMVDATREAIEGTLDPADLNSLSVAGAGGEWRYLTSDDGKLMIIDITPRAQQGVINAQGAAVTAARQVLKDTQREFPGIEAGLTGMPVVEADETAVSMADSTLTSIISLIAIAVLLVVSFHSWKMPLLMVLSLGIGIAWSYGYLTLAVGHLQVLSVVFTVILLGMGIDYGIHVVSRFELVRHDYPEGLTGFREAMIDALQSTGPGLITGALTTAIAFGTTLFTDFKGMAEMGHIAAVGLLLCLLATLTALPALMRLLRPDLRHVKPLEERVIDLHEGAWLMPVARHPFKAVTVTVIVLGLATAAATQVRYDNNLKELLPHELDSLQWLRVIEEAQMPIWFAASVTDSLEEARERSAAFRKLPAVADVGGIGYLFPRHEEEKLALIRDARQQLSVGPKFVENAMQAGQQDTAASLVQRLTGLQFALTIALQRQDVQSEPRIRAAMLELLEKVTAAINATVDPKFTANAAQRITELNKAFTAWKRRAVTQLAEALSLEPLRPEDLPEYLRLQAVSITEPTRYVVKVYPRGDVWQEEVMEPFIAQTRSVDPLITGSPIQIYESGQLMQNAYQLAGALALIVVFGVAYIDFRNLLDAFLSLLPVTAGFITTLGIMWLADVSINPANVMVLPLLFGIGVASGIHIMHRYKQERYARPLGLSEGTSKGIILTSLTTIFAFATMLLAQHRGIKSLGFVLSVGVSLTLVASLLLMPAVLELRNRYHVMQRYRQWQKVSRS